MRSRNSIIAYCALTVTAVLLAGCSAESKNAPAAEEGSGSLECRDGFITIGAAKAASGAASFFDTAGLRGLEVAVDKINNDGGIKGCQLKLESRDTKSDPGLAAQVAQSLVDDGAQILVVPDDFDNGVGAAKVGQNAGLLTLSAAASSTVFAKAVGNLFFNAGISTTELGRAQEKFAIDNGWKTGYQLIDTGLAYFTEQDEVFRSAYTADGGKMLGAQQIDSNQSDFSAAISAIKSENPDVIQLLLTYPQVGAAAKQIRSAGIDTPIVGPLTLQNQDLVKLVGPSNANNINYAVQAYYEASGVDPDTDPEIDEFVEAYKKKFGQSVEQANAVGAYQMFLAVAQALQQDDVVDATTAADAIRAQKNIDLPGGTLDHWQDGYAVWNPSIVSVNDGESKVDVTYTAADLDK